MVKYILSWFFLLIVAFLNATLRELVYKNYFAENVSHQISVFTGIILLSIAILGIVRFLPFQTPKESIGAGLIWLSMTEIFEFAMTLASGRTLFDFLQSHNILSGEFWILIPIWLAIFPYFVSKTSLFGSRRT